MKESQASIQRVRLLGNGYQQLEMAIASSLTAMREGQSVLARPKAMRQQVMWNPYLRSVWFPTRITSRLMTVEVLATDRYEPGDVIDVFGPVGKKFNYRNTLRNVLLLAYDTPPFSLLMSIPHLLGNSVSVTLVLLGSAADYPTQLLPPEVEIVRSDDRNNPWAWPDQVITIGWADQVFAAVPPANELAYFEQMWQVFKERRAEVPSGYLWGVFQSVLPCGVGACNACMVQTKAGFRLACVDGPAIDLHTVFG
ncbi:MAG: hypothetical protein AAF787_15825 [Chloroflexota bacterium]